MNIPKSIDSDQYEYKTIKEVGQIFEELLIERTDYFRVPVGIKRLNEKQQKKINEWYFKKMIEFLVKTERGNEVLNKLRYIVSDLNGCHLDINDIMEEL